MTLKLKRYHIPTWLSVTIIVPLCIFLFVAASGYFCRAHSNIISIIVCWFIIIPLLTAFLSKIISGSKDLALKSFISLVLFYGVMVFMIYKHYQTDFFKIMIASLIFNALAIYVWYDSDTYDQNPAK